MPIGPEELAWNTSTITDFRQHGGQITTGPLAGSNLLLLTTHAAVSGNSGTVPLGYSRDGDQYVVVGSNSGRSTDPVWVRNIGVNPTVSVEVGEERFDAQAVLQVGDERRRLLDSHIAAIPIFARYEEMAGRPLPVVTLQRLG